MNTKSQNQIAEVDECDVPPNETEMIDMFQSGLEMLRREMINTIYGPSCL